MKRLKSLLIGDIAEKMQKECRKKPMDGDDILEGFRATGFTGESFRLRCFNEGVRFAEKHHGITVPVFTTRVPRNKKDEM